MAARSRAAPSLSVVLAMGVSALCVSGLTACGGSDSFGGSGQSGAGERLSTPELIDKVRAGTVSVVSQPPGETKPPRTGGVHTHGSGVIYDARRGLVLTSNHLVEDASSIKVRVNERIEVQGRAVARAQCDDVALLALNPKPTGLVQIPLGGDQKLREGESVTSLGYLLPPDGQQRLLTASGAASALDVPGQIHPDLPALPSLVLHQAPIEVSSSGGPLVNDRGQLAGLTTVLEEGGSGPFKAVSSRRLEKLLGQLKPGRGSRFSGWGSQHGECHGVMAELYEQKLVSHGGRPGAKPRRGSEGGPGSGHGG